MLAVDEHSPSFQKEAIEFLLKRILDSLKIDSSKKYNLFHQIRQYLDENHINSIESLLQNSYTIAQILHIKPESFNEVIQKNYFKIIQYLKKQKETYNIFLTDEKQNLIEIISKYIFPADLSLAYFQQEDYYYVLNFPSKKIIDATVDSYKNAIERQQNNENLQEKKVSNHIISEEISIIQEILQKFPDIYVSKNLSLELDSVLNQNFTMESAIKEKQDIKQINTSIIDDNHSIIEEILNTFSDILPVSVDLQELINQEEIESNQINQSNDIKNKQGSFKNNLVLKIPLSITEYLQIRKKLHYFKIQNDSIGYQNFLQNADEKIKSCIAILNILSNEKTPNFSLELSIDKIAQKVSYSKESLLELYYRIKKYNLCIGFVKQASEYLKNHDKKLYEYFVKIYEPLLDFISLLEKDNEDFFMEKNIDKNLKLLLISVQDENDRHKLHIFLKNFIYKIRNYL
ncbi:MAG: hypothetical protein KatS3mg129_2536 [Leptospiraceae bacterium]|nr:MAG: hypothetical protein KatS3mg129_2536 [Leptospiraceae bacterium]